VTFILPDSCTIRIIPPCLTILFLYILYTCLCLSNGANRSNTILVQLEAVRFYSSFSANDQGGIGNLQRSCASCTIWHQARCCTASFLHLGSKYKFIDGESPPSASPLSDLRTDSDPVSGRSLHILRATYWDNRCDDTNFTN
jgi:hypothetical protein